MKAIKFVADVNVEKAIIDYLTKNDYDVSWIPDYDMEILDEALLDLAKIERGSSSRMIRISGS